MVKFETKDSGKRQDYASGMRRDIQEGKPRFDLIYQPMLKRVAELMARGAEKYSENNWQKANSISELKRFKASAYRHFQQYINNDECSEDHFAAIIFNISAIEYLMDKLKCDIFGRRWNKTPLLNNYEVSDTGEIRRIKDKKIMAKWLNVHGYELVSLSNENKKHYQVHRLVMSAFIGESDLQVNHKNGIKTDNYLNNLEYVTAGENNLHAYRAGLKSKSKHRAKIDYAIAEEIRLRVDNGEKQKTLALEFNISPQTVNDIIKCRIWNEE